MQLIVSALSILLPSHYTAPSEYAVPIWFSTFTKLSERAPQRITIQPANFATSVWV